MPAEHPALSQLTKRHGSNTILALFPMVANQGDMCFAGASEAIPKKNEALAAIILDPAHPDYFQTSLSFLTELARLEQHLPNAKGAAGHSAAPTPFLDQFEPRQRLALGRLGIRDAINNPLLAAEALATKLMQGSEAARASIRERCTTELATMAAEEATAPTSPAAFKTHAGMVAPEDARRPDAWYM